MSSGKRKNEKMECEGSRKSSRLIAIDEAKAALELEKKTIKNISIEFWEFMKREFDVENDIIPNNETKDYTDGQKGAKQILDSGGAITFISDKCPINLQISNTLKINMNYMYGFVNYLKGLKLTPKQLQNNYIYSLKIDDSETTSYTPDKNYEDFYKLLVEAEAEEAAKAEAIKAATEAAKAAEAAANPFTDRDSKYNFLLDTIHKSSPNFNILVKFIKSIDKDNKNENKILERIIHSNGRIENIINLDNLMTHIKKPDFVIKDGTDSINKIDIIKALAIQITLYDELDKLSEKIGEIKVNGGGRGKVRGGVKGKVNNGKVNNGKVKGGGGKEMKAMEKLKEKKMKEAEKLKEKKMKEAEKLKEKKMKEAEKLKEKKMKEKEKEKKMKEKEKKMKEKEKKMKEKEKDNNTKKKIKNKILN